MSRRNVIVTITLLLVVAANGLVLWRRSRTPLKPEVGKERLQVQYIRDWEASPVVPLTRPLAELKQVVNSFPVDQCQEISGASHVAVAQLTAEQKDDLFTAMAALLQTYQKSKPDSLLAYMEGRNERPDPLMMDRVKEEKLRDRVATSDQLKAMSDNEFITKVWDWQKCNTYFEAILMKHGNVCLWRARDLEQANKGPLGQALSGTFQNVTSYAHLFRPEFAFLDACKQPQGVLLADLTVVIQHNNDMKLERSPYFFRFWYSDHDKMWHPRMLSHVSTVYGARPAVGLLF